MSKYLDSNGLLYLWSKIKTLLGGKVDKVEGKGLSANDFTTAEKEKLAELENYTLPEATAETLGGVRVGAGLTVTGGVLSATGGGTADSVDWSNIQNKPDLALKSDLTNVYTYKGSKVNYAALPESGNTVGDVWNVEDTGMNYAWTGEGWDALGAAFEIQAITNEEIDAITAAEA
ncbi:hypothetical protein [uncultured Oscillibacter sp.]|uniref:hypothetical protein n=1 Tax=uncultured Oscillibacter sp. TaxID=876091 RepID=UPI00260EEA18|nr:hypothetical protein [uncultured Oscillibacter sp.]